MISVEAFLREHERRAQSIAAMTTCPSCDPARLHAAIHDAASRMWGIFPVSPVSSLRAQGLRI